MGTGFSLRSCLARGYGAWTNFLTDRPIVPLDEEKTSFQSGSRPVIRWIKGDGLDDPVTRTAIAQATRLFGDSVDYCLCTNGLTASRVRRLLSWAERPVEWMPVGPNDNPELAHILAKSGCGADQFGYWWKWFPERVRLGGPEWILDGDMVVIGPPDWFEDWKQGSDPLRVSQDDHWPLEGLYGEYVALADHGLRLYSGLISLPPGLRYMPTLIDVLHEQPLAPEHDGCENMSEQGVIAVTFARLNPKLLPLSEFPFGRAFEDAIDYGLRGPAENVWGYHFGNSFRRRNPHFERLCKEGALYTIQGVQPPEARFVWLQNFGQWGRPGWSMHTECLRRIRELAKRYAGRPTLEIGTSRGYLTANLATCGCLVTTIDHVDRGASRNLEGMEIEFIINDAVAHLLQENRTFDLITVDLHGNDERTWKRLWPVLVQRLSRDGTLVLYNSHLWKIDEFKNETGLKWVAESAMVGFEKEVYEEPLPGMIVCRHA